MVKGESSARRGVAVPQPAFSPQPSQRRARGQLPRRPTPPSPLSSPSPPRPSQRGVPSSQGALNHRRAPLSTQPSQRGDDDPHSPMEALSDEETNKLVAEVMRHMLFRNHQHPHVPVRRDELVAVITKTYKQRYLPSSVISKAQTKLRATFGLEMKELLRIRTSRAAKSANAAAQADVKQYVLTSTVPEASQKRYIATPASAAVLGFTLLVVGAIKISGGEKVPEETVIQSLRRFGIEGESDHPVFGNIKNALETLSKQRYIQKEKLSGNDGEGYVYELAERALDVAFTTRMDSFMADIVTRINNTAR